MLYIISYSVLATIVHFQLQISQIFYFPRKFS